MMTKEELQRRIEAINVKLGKIDKRITKWESKKSVEAFWKENEGWYNPNWETREEYQKRHYGDYIDNCNSEIRRANNDKNDLLNTKANYETRLKELTSFEEKPKVQAIVDFLEKWGNQATEWYIKNSERYIKLHNEHDEAYALARKEHIEQYGDFSRGYGDEYHWKYGTFEREYYSGIDELTKELTSIRRGIDKVQLNKYIEDEKVRKYKDLERRITKVVGEVVDASNLSVGFKSGELNGIIIGTNGTAKIETISAGGWNIQCFHYRVLIHKIK